MQQGTQEEALRTRVYIDGYNLYYGCLKRSPYKWLDLRRLIERILLNVPYERNGIPVCYRLQTPSIKYFTASILQTFAKSDDSVACQAHYHSALRGQLGHEVQIIKGYYDARRARAREWTEGKAARESEKIEIWKLEEKQSDVSLALHAYSDAIRNEVEQVVIVTNDTDFAPALA